MNNLGIFGIGGFGREIYQIAKYQYKNIFFVYNIKDLNYFHWRKKLPNILSLRKFSKKKNSKIIIAIADPFIRKKVFLILLKLKIKITNLVSKNAILNNSKLGVGSIICDHVCITTDVVIGKSFHANIYSYVAHDCKIGNFVTFAPSVKCNGNVTIKDNVYVGTGAIIKHGTTNKPIIIGKNSIISAGTYVNKSIPDNHMAYGNPCKIIKKNEKK
jgi:sugar O-acyltransferase (sialic acid O-acetyltransferase NeuD family)